MTYNSAFPWIRFFCFPVYPIFVMNKHGFTIDTKIYPEGYITDLLFPTAQRRLNSMQNSEPTDISVDLINLPVTASVQFNLETIKMSGSIEPSFVIGVDESRVLQPIYTTNTSIESLTVTATNSQSVTLQYEQKSPFSQGEYVRIKYKGKLS